MIIKERKYKKVKRVINELVSNEVFGCDECRNEIKYEGNYLELTVFPENGGDRSTERLEFCAWFCVFKYVPKIKCNYFVSMPMLHYDRKGKTSAEEFMRLTRNSKK